MRVKSNSLLAVLVGLTLNFGYSSAAQAALPPSTVNLFHYDQEHGIQTGNFTFEISMDSPWSWSTPTHGATVSATSEPLPALAASANSGLIINPAYQNFTQNYVRATLRYYFSIGGSNTNALVPVRISGIFNVNADNLRGSISVSATVFDPGVQHFYNFNKTCTSTCAESGVFAGLVNLAPNKQLAIELQTELLLRSQLISGSSISSAGSTYIDPYIEIDPIWALANPGYSISVSPGVGNTVPVPEAETYAMMLAGLGLVGFMARRRKQIAA